MSFTPACDVADLRDDEALPVTVGDLDLAVVKVGDEVFAITDECSHAAVALSEGDIEGCTLECWMHGSRFDLRTGQPLGPPATDPVPVFPVRVEDDVVLIDVGDN